MVCLNFPVRRKKRIMSHVLLFGFLLVWLLSSACATTRHYEAEVASWVGKDSSELTAQWGVPHEIKWLSDGTRSFEYVKRDKALVRISERGTASHYESCRTSFIVNEAHRVVGWTQHGYDCRDN